MRQVLTNHIGREWKWQAPRAQWGGGMDNQLGLNACMLATAQPLTVLSNVGRGQIEPYDTKIGEKCLYSPHNNTVLIKQIPLFDTALLMTKT